MSYAHLLSFTVFFNGAYIGTMVEPVAHIVAKKLCAKVGDVVTVSLDPAGCDEMYDLYTGDMYYQDTTFCYIGDRVMSFTEKGYFGGEDLYSCDTKHNVPKLRTLSHSNRLSGFKYNRPEYRGGYNGPNAQRTLSHMKRDMRRSERRVGKQIISEMMSEEV